jgi:hypothetical protein
MDLASRFAQVNTSNIVSVDSLEKDRRYPVTYAQRQETVYGQTVFLTLRVGASGESVKIFLPKRYGLTFKDDDIVNINGGTLSLNIIYHGLFAGSKAFKLTLEA